VPLFEKLHGRSRYRWSFFCDDHPGGDFSGLAAPDLGALDVRRTRNRHLGGPFLWQSGLDVRRPEFDALMVDLGWTIVSNPFHLMRARRRGLATIGWSKGVAQEGGPRKSGLRLAVERWLTFRCDALVAYGKLSRDYFVRLGFPAERIFVAQNAVDTARIARERAAALAQRDERRRALALPDRPVVGFLGKIAPFKQVDRLVAAYELARRDGLDALLVIAGKGPGRAALEAQIAASPFRPDIYYVPNVPAGTEPGWFQLFDLYLSFSQGGLAILEAMAHGRAVLSTPEKFPETELLADNATAFLSADFTVESFARRMREALASAEQRAAIGRAAEARVLAEATQEKMVEAIDAAVDCALVRRHSLAHSP
jgi:glycosyltransferase involved in cell wall biosynthesis